MRIISGKYKGKKLSSSDDLHIRPTTDRVKEVIFNVLQDFPQDKIVIDMFSGSGNLGIEALSRGAQKIYFVDKSTVSVSVLKKNLSNLKIPNSDFEIVLADALHTPEKISNPVDLLLLDPPFVFPEIQALLDILFKSKLISDQSILVLEHEISNPIIQESNYYEIIKQKKFGRSLISFLIKKRKKDD